MATTIQAAERKGFEKPDETRMFAKGKLDVVNVGGTTMGRAVFHPGWKWSECIKPIAKTNSCTASHLGYVISGRMTVVMDDGKTIHFQAGDAMSLPPGHDAWVDGSEDCIIVDFTGFENYAKPR